MKNLIRRGNVKFSNRKVGQKRAKQLYANWMKKNEPFLYKVGVKRAQLQRQSLNGMGAIDWSGLFSNITDTVKQLAPAALQYKQQKKIMDMQMKRAEQGLPPADVADYTPAIKIEPQINEQTEAAITRVAQQSISSGLSKLALPLGLGIAALLFFRGQKRGR